MWPTWKSVWGFFFHIVWLTYPHNKTFLCESVKVVKCRVRVVNKVLQNRRRRRWRFNPATAPRAVWRVVFGGSFVWARFWGRVVVITVEQFGVPPQACLAPEPPRAPAVGSRPGPPGGRASPVRSLASCSPRAGRRCRRGESCRIRFTQSEGSIYMINKDSFTDL